MLLSREGYALGTRAVGAPSPLLPSTLTTSCTLHNKAALSTDPPPGCHPRPRRVADIKKTPNRQFTRLLVIVALRRADSTSCAFHQSKSLSALRLRVVDATSAGTTLTPLLSLYVEPTGLDDDRSLGPIGLDSKPGHSLNASSAPRSSPTQRIATRHPCLNKTPRSRNPPQLI